METQMNKQAFIRMLINTPLEEYADNLYNSLEDITTEKKSEVRKHMESYYDEWEKERIAKLESSIEIAKVLLICESKKLKEVKICGSCKEENIKFSKEMSDAFSQWVKDKYFERRMNFRPMTMEEEAAECGYTIEEWMELQNHIAEGCYFSTTELIKHLEVSPNDEEVNMPEEEIAKHEEAMSYLSNLSEEDIARSEEDAFRAWHIEEHYSVEQIQNTIIRLEKSLNETKRERKKGAPKKNLKLYSAILIFKEINFGKNNAEYKLIFDCLDFFKLIDEGLKERWKKIDNPYCEKQYIKSLFRAVSTNISK